MSTPDASAPPLAPGPQAPGDTAPAGDTAFTTTSLQADRSWSGVTHAIAIRIPRRLDQASQQRRRIVNLRRGR